MNTLIRFVGRILLLLLLAALLAWGGMIVFNLFSKAPDGLGVREGRLAACPASPNCVSSQADPADGKHYVEPFPVPEDVSDPIGKLAAIVEDRAGARIVTRDAHYLHAEFTTPLMRFVDDVELYAPPGEAIVHVRSASRIGYSDLGANRKRIEDLRAEF